MNCQEFWNDVPQATTPRAAMPPLADATAWANHEHLADCPACAARLRSQLALQKGLRAVAGQMSRIAAPPRVEARLTAAFRAHAELAAGGSQSIRVRTRWMPIVKWVPAFNWAAAAAAMFVAAVFLSGGLFVGNHQPELASPAAWAGVEVAVAGMPAEIEAGGTPVVENGFIPLPNAAQIGPNEEVNLVRVEFPRSAMIALGYDVKPEEASESVQADVMLGNDGLARAVRFID
jgi:hypothetical protein